MSRWEDKYNKIMAAGIDNLIEEQNRKMNEARREQARLGTNVSSKEYQDQKRILNEAKMEKQKLEQMAPNLKKVTNIIEFRKKLEKKINEYYKVQDLNKQIKRNQEKINRREKTFRAKSAELNALTKQLKAGGLTPQAQAKLNMQINRVSREKEDAYNDKQNLTLKNKALNEELGNNKYGELDNKAVNKTIRDLGAAIVKCDMACSLLMNGKKIEDLKFDRSKVKYTRPKVKEDEVIKLDKEIEMDDFEQIGDSEGPKVDYTRDYEEPKADYMKDDEEPKSEFATRHPRLARMGEFFRKIKNKILRKEEVTPEKSIDMSKPIDSEEITPEELKPKTQEEKQKEEEITDKELLRMVDDVLEDNDKLADLGNKGVNEFRDSIKVEMREKGKKELQRERDKNRWRPKDQIGAEKMSEGYREAMREQDMSAKVGKQIAEKKAAEGREPGDD